MSSSSKKPSELMQCSAPGMSGMLGVPPTAMSTWSAESSVVAPSAPSTATVLGPVKRAVPVTFSTSEFARLRS